MKSSKILLSLIPCLLMCSLTGCGPEVSPQPEPSQQTSVNSSSQPPNTSSPLKKSSPKPKAPSKPSMPQLTAEQIAVEVGKRLKPKLKAIAITEDNDPNNLLGKVNGYTRAAVLYDKRMAKGNSLKYSCDLSEPGVHCGATIEQFESSKEAVKRKDYLASISSPLIDEYNYLSGHFLLRVSGEYNRQSAKAIANTFEIYAK